MATELPERVFRRPPLRERPNNVTTNRQEVINAYNLVYDRFLVREINLGDRFRRGEFNGLPTITEKIRNSEALTEDEEVLIEDYSLLIDSRTARHGARNLNTADQVERIDRNQRQGLIVSEEDQRVKELYQRGEFNLIEGMSHRLSGDITVNRFVVPIVDNGKEFAVIDGAPVEGMIRLIDRELQETLNNSALTEAQRSQTAARLRRERDVLYSSSTVIFDREDSVFHARNQLESYYKHLDPIRSEYELPDWFKSEYVLKERRVLDIPPVENERYRNRWLVGCLPLPLILPLVLCAGLNFSTAPCYGSGEGGKRGELALETFDPSKSREPISVKGAIERQLGVHLTGQSQFKYTEPDNPRVLAALDRVKEDKDFYDFYLKVSEDDYRQAAQKIRGDSDPSLWVGSTEFDKRQNLASCLSPESRIKRTVRLIEEKNNPQWWHPIRNAFFGLMNYLPEVNINIR